MTRGIIESDQNPSAERGTELGPMAIAPSSPGNRIMNADSAITLKPLAVILSSSGKNTIEPGNTFFIGVTVSNRSATNVTAQVFIDHLPPLLQQWCPISQEYLALAPGQSGEVVFPLHVPVDALPNTYAYLVVVDAPDQDYPPSTYAQQLQILPLSHEISVDSDPTFVVQPPTTAAAPGHIQRSGTLPVQVAVYNRSDRVDRFRLRCLDLPDTWFTVTYPRDDEGVGLILDADSLRLNPGDQGVILFTLHPPFEARAGRYEPTVQLISENEPMLGLLDVIYFQILPAYALQPAFQTIVGRVSGQPGQFEVWLGNEGNCDRHLMIDANDSEEGELCRYTLAPNPITVVPQTTGRVVLTVQPTQWWRRPWFGGGKVINLRVLVADPDHHPVPNNVLQSTLIWAPRPWWQVWPLILLAIGSVGILIWAIWWYLLRPPVLPSIANFFTEDVRYAAVDGDTARVGWQIDDPGQIRSLRLVGRSPDGMVISGPLDYEFTNNTVPPGLQPFCQLDETQLQCRNIQTDARQPGTYQFELTVTPKRRRRRAPLPSETSDLVVIDPVPSPTITQFASMQAVYQEQPSLTSSSPSPEAPASTPDTGTSVPGEITLNWIVDNPGNLQSLILRGRTGDGTSLGDLQYDFVVPGSLTPQIPVALEPYCDVTPALECLNIPTGIQQAGDYTFELIAHPLFPQSVPSEPITTDVVKILPVPPAIANFQINGEEAPAKYLIPVEQGGSVPVVELAWDVVGGSSTVVELSPSPGSVPLQGTLAIPLSQQPGTTVLSLTVSNNAGQTLTRSVTLETFDPTPTDPVEAAAAAIAAATQAAEMNTRTGSPTETGSPGAGLGAPFPSDPGRLSPTETPPEFD
ncbi:MAG: hypothetical protein F6K09_01495 [Merismopedia sp. SIO2A8]|nr:hypothetical protein [Symploca sp. SIO2B6]NET47402.1 hypothetical protein [Merismopedia sp. SIO2A8]